MSLTMLCPRVSLTILRPAHVSLPARSLPHCCRVTSVDPTHPPASTPRGRYPKTRTAALRMVQYYTNLVQRAGGHATVSVKKWPYTNDLARAARLVLADPRAAAAGLVAEPWMTDPVQSLFRERWRDFLEKAGLTKIKVWLHGIDTLGQTGAGLKCGLGAQLQCGGTLCPITTRRPHPRAQKVSELDRSGGDSAAHSLHQHGLARLDLCLGGEHSVGGQPGRR